MRVSFRRELQDVLDELVRMMGMARTAMHQATEALLEADVQLADSVIAADAELDDLREETDARAVSLLALQAPVATDLRSIVTAMRISSDIERMGDLARHVAKVARMRFPDQAVPEEVEDVFRSMGESAEQICRAAEEALASLDGLAAHEIEQLDDDLDDAHRELFDRLLQQEWSHGTTAAVDTTLLSRYYERFGDHAVSVARRVRFLVTADSADLADRPTDPSRVPPEEPV
nr:phosphate signaling complex protein PhoU [Kribbia dieselivorans]